jgi:hypothetical protein
MCQRTHVFYVLKLQDDNAIAPAHALAAIGPIIDRVMFSVNELS